jgi:putative protein kinase ArgK-like GTPase of G3E family
MFYSKWHIFSKAIETNEKQLTKSWKPHVSQNVISEKEGVKHKLKDTVYFPADIFLMLTQHTDQHTQTAKKIRDAVRANVYTNWIVNM